MDRKKCRQILSILLVLVMVSYLYPTVSTAETWDGHSYEINSPLVQLSSGTSIAKNDDADESDAIFLDGAASTNGDGAKGNPFNNFASAVTAVASAGTKTIYITGQITISDHQEWNMQGITGAAIKRSSLYNGYLINVVSGGDLTLSNITIDGNISNTPNSTDSIINVNGGTLSIKEGTLLRNNIANAGGAIRVIAGTATMTGGEVSGNSSRTMGGGIVVLSTSPASYGTFTINGGKITDNTAVFYGGGISTTSYGVFNNLGGSISGNTPDNILSSEISYDISWNGSGTSSDPYLISSSAELKGLAVQVNSGITYEGIYFKLTNDVDLLGQEWTPIGGACSIAGGVPTGEYFSGVFDGQNHTIKGIKITDAIQGYGAYGLFGYVNGGVIGNLNIEGQVNTGNLAIPWVGGLVGYQINGSIYNVSSSMTISANNASASQCGGIVGAIKNTGSTSQTVKYCANTGAVLGGQKVGGIVGAIYCKNQGGVVVDQCYNTGQITTVGTVLESYAGGITGYCQGYITSCYNLGNMISAAGGHYMAGIVGRLQGANPQASLSNCYSTANFVNYLQGYDRFLFASVEENNTLPISNCFWKATNVNMSQPTANGSNNWGKWTNVGAKTEAEMIKTSMLENLGGTNFTQTTGNYPVLAWQNDHQIVKLSNPGTSAPPFANDTDESDAVYLNGTALSNGNGTKGSPFNNFASAVSAIALAGTKTIYISGKVTISDYQTWSLLGITGAVVKRSSQYNGYLVNVISGGALNLSNLDIDGNYNNALNTSGSLINVDGGNLYIGANSKLKNNMADEGGAVRVIAGTAIMTGGEISGNRSRTMGGGIAVLATSSTSYGTFNFNGGTITGNVATYFGGGVSKTGFGTFSNSVDSISGNFPDNVSWSGSGTANDPYLIGANADFKELADQVNKGISFEGTYFKLTNDIDLRNNEWTPIGGTCKLSYDGPTGLYFAGIFDGQNHTIRGIKISKTREYYVGYGLFGYVKNGVIGNLNLEGLLSTKDDINGGGGLIGYLENGNVYNVSSSMNISINTECAYHCGGIVGLVVNNTMKEQTIKYCSNTGAVTGGAFTGGIVGSVYCTRRQGGVVVDQCYNTGQVTAMGMDPDTYTGGIVGYCQGFISNCYNWGNLTSKQRGYPMGGIVGVLKGLNPRASLTNSYSIASFTGYNQYYDRFLFASVEGSNTVPIKNCFWKATNGSMTQPTANGINGWGAWTNVSVRTESELRNKTMLGSLGAAFTQNSGAYPTLNYQISRPVVILSSSPSTSPVILDTDKSDAVFLNGAVATNGNGTKGNPFNNFASAATAIASAGTKTIYIAGPVTISNHQAWNLQGITGAAIKRSSLYNGNLINVVSGGDLTLNNITIDGNISNTPNSMGSLINVDGGTLSINEGTLLRNNIANAGGAVRVIAGNATMNGGEISGNGVLYMGGGVAVLSTNSNSFGTFNLVGGRITGNTAVFYGGGVSTTGYGVFNNSGGSISGNTPDSIVSSEVSSDTNWSGSGTSSDPYLISSSAELKGLAVQVNYGASYGGTYFKLTNDIDLSGYNWTPIGGACSIAGGVPTGKYFSGVFDGQNHTIKGIKITDAIQGYGAYGLFGYVNGGVIGNLNIEGQVNTGNLAIPWVGGLVGYQINGSIYNVSSSMTISANNASASQCGGIVGAIKNTGSTSQTVKYCANTGAVLSGQKVGGIVGAIYCTNQGGVVVDQCYNTGQITTVGTVLESYAGGIAGYCQGYIASCYNLGNMISAAGGHYMAGIVGCLQGANPQARMSNCYSVANFVNYLQGVDRFLYASVEDSNTLPITYCFWKYTNSGMSQPTSTGQNGWGIWNDSHVATESQILGEDEIFGEGLYVIDYLNSIGDYSQSEGEYPILDWQNNRPVVTLHANTSAPTAVDYDEDGAVFLDGTASVNGLGTKASPFNNFTSATAAVATADTPIIYIRGQMNVSDVQTLEGPDIYLMRSSIYSGYLVNVVSGGSLTLRNITIDGNCDYIPDKSSSLINVGGGILNIESDTVMQNNIADEGGAIRITSGLVNMNDGMIWGNRSRTIGGGVAILSSSPSSYGTFNLSGGTISANKAAVYGGGIYRDGNAATNISGGRILDNDPDNVYIALKNKNETEVVVGLSPKAGKFYPVSVRVESTTNLVDKEFTLTYDPEVLKVADLCALTYETELKEGKINEYGITITSVSSGKIVFVVNKDPINNGYLSYIVNIFQFKSLTDRDKSFVNISY